jgi:hypothetical protein
MQDLLVTAGDLTKYAWRFRYPGAPYQPDPEEGRAASILAHSIVDAVLARLPIEARP